MNIKIFFILSALIYFTFAQIDPLPPGPGLRNGFKSIYKVETNSSLIYFDEVRPGVIHHGRNPETGEISENAFRTYIVELQEVTPNGTIVQHVFANDSTYNIDFNLPSFVPSVESGLSFVNAYRMVYTSTLSGISIIFFVFEEDQEITDLITNKTTFVPEGSVKFSLSIPIWPFLNEDNELQISANISTIIPNEMTECNFTPDNTAEFSVFQCKSNEISGILQLQKSASEFNYVTQQRREIRPTLLIYACPLQSFAVPAMPSPEGIYGSYCNVSMDRVGEFPPISSSISSDKEEELACNSEVRERRPAVIQLEIRMHIDNFINSGIDYDPGFTVLFEGSGREDGGGTGACGEFQEDEYSVLTDWIFWASVSSAVGMCLICLVLLVIGSTNKGFEFFRGRKTVTTMRRSLKQSRRGSSSDSLQGMSLGSSLGSSMGGGNSLGDSSEYLPTPIL